MRLALAFMVAVLAVQAAADVRKVRPDGQITFTAAMDGPTRISVKGDRIKDIIQTDSQFEMANDEGTGDVFLRFIGSEPEPESGYIITEAGHTVGFKMTPKAGLDTQTLIIQLIGVKPADAAEEKPTSPDAGPVGASGFAISDGASDSYAGLLTDIVRETILTKIAGRSAAKVKSTATVGTLRKGGLHARAFAVATKSGARPLPQQFYTSRTVAVWVDDVSASGKFWVVVVENKK